MFEAYHDSITTDNAFVRFLTKIKTKEIVEIQYYTVAGRRQVSEYSFIGYETTGRGLHGIHYSGNSKTYSFGERDTKEGRKPVWLNHSQVEKIPDEIKEGFLKAITEKRSIKLKKTKRPR